MIHEVGIAGPSDTRGTETRRVTKIARIDENGGLRNGYKIWLPGKSGITDTNDERCTDNMRVRGPQQELS